jgi:hypothetical protein
MQSGWPLPEGIKTVPPPASKALTSNGCTWNAKVRTGVMIMAELD